MNLSRMEKYRRPHPIGLPQKPGDDFGWFEVPIKRGGPVLRIQVAPGFEAGGWEHASISLAFRCPTWEEMCMVKDLIWEPEDTVVQYHPPKSEYVNCMPYCLHLWRQVGAEFPRPPIWTVGPK